MTKVSSVVIHGEPIDIDSLCVANRLAVDDKNKDGVIDAKDGFNDSQIAFKLVDAYGYEVINKPCRFNAQWSAQFSSNMVQQLVYLLQTSRELIKDIQAFENGLHLRENQWGLYELEAANADEYWQKRVLLKRLDLGNRLGHYLDGVNTFANAYLQRKEFTRTSNIYVNVPQLPYPMGLQALITSWIKVHNQYHDLIGDRGLELECDAPFYTWNDSCDEGTDTISIYEFNMFDAEKIPYFVLTNVK